MYILNDNIKYYTKEFIKLLKIAFVAFLIITAIILIKYKPHYEVSINNKKIGYVTSKNDINNYINQNVASLEKNNIALVTLESTPSLKLKLVNRNIDEQEEVIKSELKDQLNIQYTTFAISINGENKTYVSTQEEAQNIVDELKKDYDEKYTDKLGILQVYSENDAEILAVSNEKAKENISNELNNMKKSNETVKVASTKKTTTTKKSSSINGIKLSVKPLSGIITSRYGKRSSPGGGVGSTNHKGLDIAAKQGTTIKAAASGKVIFSGNKGSLWNLVIIDHGNGVQTYYGHCRKLYVSAGAKVSQGQTIAAVGSTGNSTGPHLHLEVRVNGVAYNPQNYVY